MPPVPGAVENGTTVRDVRFGDAQNGWLYGGALYATHDGGATWAVDPSLPNAVIDVAAESGNVWAVALSATSSGELYGLYHATYGSGGATAWSQVQLGPLVGQPSLAVIKRTAYLVEGADARQVTYLITNGGNTYVTRPGPCSKTATGLGSGTLSVSGDGSLWGWCTAGHVSVLEVSTDGATHWQGQVGNTTTSVGGVDSSRAIVSDGARLTAVTLGQAETTPAIPDARGQTDARFIGFTTTKIGFLIDYSLAGAELWRTTDSGQTWAAVTF